MRTIVQRVNQATLEVESRIISTIDQGLLIYLGITHDDNEEDIKWLVQKIAHMRIFNDHEGKMNLSAVDLNLSAMVVSQFTLYASTKKGNRPSYLDSARPEIAVPLYESFLQNMAATLPTVSGIFGAHMHIKYTNDGPVTIPIDSKQRT